MGKGKSLLYLEFESDAGEKNMGQVENIDDEKNPLTSKVVNKSSYGSKFE